MFEQEATGSAPEPVQAETPAVEAPVTEGAPQAESKPTEPDAAAETKKALKGVQKRIDELTRRNYETEERGRQEAEHWRRQAEANYAELQKYQAAVKPPQLDQYPDLQTYTADAARFEAERIVREQLEQQRAADQQAQQAYAKAMQQQAAQQRFNAELEARLTEAEKKYPDFREKVQSPTLPGIINTPAFQAIYESDIGADVMYYLANNPQKAHQIVALSPIGQVREIARIEASIQNGRTVTSAPPPPNTVGGGPSSGTKDLSRMNYDDFVKERRRQLKR